MTAIAFLIAVIGVGTFLNYAGDVFGRELSVGQFKSTRENRRLV